MKRLLLIALLMLTGCGTTKYIREASPLHSNPHQIDIDLTQKQNELLNKIDSLQTKIENIKKELNK